MRKYIKIGTFKIAIGVEKSSWYLIPTICVVPDQVAWLDDEQRWDNNHRIITTSLEWLCFYIELELIKKRRKNK